MKLLGQVKTLTDTVSDVYELQGKAQKKLRSVTAYRFNEKGCIVEKTITIETGKMIGRDSNIYDQQEQLTTSYRFIDDELYSHSIFRYDSSHRLILQQDSSLDGKLLSESNFKYLDNGYQCTKVVYSPAGKVIKIENTRFGTNGLKIEAGIIEPRDSFSQTTKFEYDAYGKLIMERADTSRANHPKKTIYKYDENGLETEVTACDRDSNLLLQKASVYSKFDKTGNWREQTTKWKGLGIVITTRSIQYF